MIRSIYAAVLLAGTSLGLASCGSEAEEPAVMVDENSIAGVEVTNARLVLPPVSGNPAAVYFDLANNGDRNLAFRNAEVADAGRAEMHDTIMEGEKMVMGEAPPILVERGGNVSFEPGGKHIMVFELPEDIAEGSTAEVTLIAAGNRRHTFEATVQSAGDDR